LRNPCTFQKIRRIYKIFALLQKSGGFKNSWRFTEKQVDLRNLGALQKNRRMIRVLAGLKIPAPGEKPTGLEKAGGKAR
jgi:hypothetical protein